MHQENPEYFLVDKRVLPEVFIKVMEVKQRLNTGESMSVNEAVRKTGLSRSAYYKYKDSVFSYEELFTRRIVNLHLLLNDSPGVLSNALSFLHSLNANILTLNQSIPVDGVTQVNISLRLSNSADDQLVGLDQINELDGVLEAKILSAE